MSTNAQIEAWAICKRFGNFDALKDVSLNIKRGEFLSLLGPSGSGKTTFLTVLAGFIAPTSGSIVLEGREVTQMPAKDRGFGMVFQGYALFPHLTVEDNIAFPLKVQKRSRDQIKARVAEMIEMVGLQGHAHKRPSALSGGQQQRVALARALAYEPPVLLLDEPFSALDKNLRSQMQDEMRRLHRELGTTFVFVTHDQEEAMALSTHIAIFNQGALQQLGTPEDVYERPANRFVGEFLGELNVFPLKWSDGTATFNGMPIDLPEQVNRPNNGDLAIRPEHMALVSPDSSHTSLPMRVLDSIYMGRELRLMLEAANGVKANLNLRMTESSQSIQVGSEVNVGWETRRSFLI